MNDMTFGECLKCMLSALDVSMNRLAKSINVDNSLVNRWVHGERIPPYGSSYIENIAEYLSKNVRNAYQIKNLNEVFIRQGLCPGNSSNMEDIMKRFLSEAQGYSYECRKKLLADKKIKNIKENVDDVKNYKERSKSPIETNTEAHIFEMKTAGKIFELSGNDKIIFGSDNIAMLVLDLLDEAASTDLQGNKIIYMTYNNNASRNNDEIVQTRSCLARVIKKGWKIIVLIKLDNNLNRIRGFIRFAMPLIRAGGLIIYYCTKYGLFDVEKETLVIPGIGAMSGFIYSCDSDINTAFYLKSMGAVNVLKEYFETMLKNGARQLVKYFEVNEYTEYCRILIEADEAVGSRMSYKSDLSTIMLPEKTYVKLLKKYKFPDDVAKFAFKNYKKQRDDFKKNIINYEYNEIYLMDSISSLIKRQEFYLQYYSGIQRIKLDTEDIVELLENIIHILKTYKHYNISFINKKTENLITTESFSFVLKERTALFYENYKLKNNYPVTSIFVDEPFFVKAFEEYFGKVWGQITLVYKEKAEIIQLLQRHMDAILGTDL